MSKITIFDVETCALPESELAPFMPEFEAPKNYTDSAKIKAAIETKKKAWLEDAALSPVTGKILAIGLMTGTPLQFIVIAEPATEAQMLHEFWDAIKENGSIGRIIGFCCNTFDLPFLIKRSWKLGVPFPTELRQGRYFSNQVTDLREVWQLGDRQAEGNLDTIAKHLGVGAKTGKGSEFAGLWATDRAKAIEYLKNDLALTAAVATKLGVI